MPWQIIRNPAEQWQALPSFMVGEALFITLALVALWHARSRGRVHLLVWLGALIAGTANDLIFMALPLVDNFWHSQATIMLTPRLPIYIPCVYISFLYYPTVAVRRLRMPSLAAAALTGLVAIVFYAPFDITGAKLIWWTWHDTDIPVASRILGAPTSSTLWVLTFAGSFAWLIDRVVRREVEAKGSSAIGTATFLKGIAAVAGLSTVLMVLQITVLQQLDGGASAYWALGAGVLLYAGLAARGARSLKPDSPVATDRPALVAVLAYAATLVLTMALSDPGSHRSTGVHQVPGRCYVEAQDITGLTRHEFLCVEDYDEDFNFECTETPSDGARWYTICGNAHAGFGTYISGVGALGAAIALFFSLLFAAERRAPVEPTEDST